MIASGTDSNENLDYGNPFNASYADVDGFSSNLTLHDRHIEEWRKSGIDESIIWLNLRSVEGYTAYEYLFYSDSIERLNTGRLTSGTLRAYKHIEDGGWFCPGSGGNFDPSMWGCFKPDNPRTSKDGKIIKYEHPLKTPTEAFFLVVPERIWIKIAERYGLTVNVDDYVDFWDWVAKTKIPILLTEGVKKAGTLLSEGYCAIALPGIWGAYRSHKDEFGNAVGMPYLIPQLAPFTNNEREFIFVYDQDPKPKTRQAVRKAVFKTGGLLRNQGCKVSIVTWDETDGKGVDDLLVGMGADYFSAFYENRVDLDQYKLAEFTDLSPYVDLTIHERYLPEGLVPPSDAQIIGIRSMQNTGKTEWLAKMIAPLLAEGKQVLVVCHREQLARGLAARFGIDYRVDIKISETEGIFGYTLCIDSMHPKANPPFIPEQWPETTLIFDEVEQTLRHVLLGSTCQNRRVAILRSLREILQVSARTGGKIYLADADLSPIPIIYFQQLIGFPVKTWVVDNTYIPNKGKRKAYIYSDQESAIKKACEAIKAGKKILIHTDGQKHKSTWGTRNLEVYLKRNFPKLKILRIDRESVSDEKHKAFGCMNDINGTLENYDVVIASPTIETGISIDKDIFAEVILISHGVQTVDSVCQAAERNRTHIDRHLYINKYSGNMVGDGSTNLRAILSATNKYTEATLKQLMKAGLTGEISYLEDDMSVSPSMLAYGKIACLINQEIKDFKGNTIKKLERMGYEIIEVSDEDDGNKKEAEKIKEEVKKTKEMVYNSYCHKVSKQKNITDEEYKALKEKPTKTKDELHIEKKAELSRKYKTNRVTPDLVRKDDDGWYKQTKLHYYLMIDRLELMDKEKSKLDEFLTEGDGQLFKPDINKTLISLKIAALDGLGIQRFFDREALFTSDDLAEWFAQINTLAVRAQIKLILGIKINPDRDTPMAVVQRILGLMGLRCEFAGWHRIDGKAKRFYRGCDQNPDGRQEVFSRWLKGGDPSVVLEQAAS